MNKLVTKEQFYDEVMHFIRTMNNTITWRYGDYIFIDTMKHPKTVRSIISAKFSRMLKFETLQYITSEHASGRAILFGVTNSGMYIAERLINCHCIRIEIVG